MQPLFIRPSNKRGRRRSLRNIEKFVEPFRPCVLFSERPGRAMAEDARFHFGKL
jgi:hypothetical protein